MRKTFVIVAVCVMILFAGYAGYRTYLVWKHNHLMSLAHQFMAKSDGRNALLCVQQVLRSDPRNLDATRAMAELAEAARLPNVLLWRSRVVELNPRSLDDRLALAQTAMKMGDYASATNALEGVESADKKTATYHNVAGAVAAAANHPAQAEEHFLEASRLDPQNPVPQLNLAVVRLHGTNASDLAAARTTLQLFSSNPTNSQLRCQALRELVVDAVHSKDIDTAQAFSKLLLLETNAVFTDRILRLDILRGTKNEDFNRTLKESEREAAGERSKIYELATWEMAKTSPKDALIWLKSLPANAQTNQPAALLITECYTIQQDWTSLGEWLKDKSWGDLEFLRHAFQSRAFRGLGLTDSAQTEWEKALKAASGKKQGLVMLLNLASQWNMRSEAEELLFTIVSYYPGEEWARQALVRALYAGGRTRSLMQLYGQQLKRVPTDIEARNNLAMTALLLDAQELKPYDLAREVYQKSPTNSSYVSTYAFSLYMQGKYTEAIKVIEKLKPQEINDPSIAGYYGLILKAAGNRAGAMTYLNVAMKAHLLPEERKLFESAKAGT